MQEWRPLGSAQRGIWFAHELGATAGAPPAVYNTAEYAVLRGSLQLDLLVDAITAVLEATEVLRLELRSTDDGPQQRIPHRPPGFQVEIVDMRAQADPPAAAEDWMRRQVAQRIEFGRDRLVTEALLRIGTEETWWFQQVHHLCADGYAASLLFSRVAAAYTAALQGDPLTQPPDQLTAVLAEDEAYTDSEQHRDDREHWREQLAGSSAPPSLTLRPDLIGDGPSPWFLRSSVPVPDSLGEALLAAGPAIRPAMWTDLLLAGTAGYVARMSGTAEVRLGLPMMNRTGSVATRVACTTMNVVPAALPVHADTTVAHLLRAAVAKTRRCRQHSRYREEDLRHDARTLGAGLPYAQQLNLIPFYPQLRFGSTQAELHNVCAGPVDDLTFCLRGTPGRGPAVLEVDGNPRLYSETELAQHAHRLLAFWERLALIAADAEAAAATPVADLDLLAPGERELVVTTFNDTAHPLHPRTLVEAARQAAQTWPDTEALRFEGVALSYREFDARVESLARRLAGLGVRRGALVAVGLPRSLELLIAIHAVVRAGAAYLPLDVEDPAGRRRLILEAADPALLLAGHTTAADWSLPSQLQVWDTSSPVDATGRPVPGADDAATEPESPGIDDAAYVLYTSGSTGTPKGVVITHRAIDNRLQWMQAEFGLTLGERVLQKTSIGFDVSVWELFWPLQVGACLSVAPPGVHRDPAALADLIAAERISTVHFVPSMLVPFADELSTRADTLIDGRFAALRRIICSGEALSANLAAQAAAASGADVINLYGPTEAAVDVSCHWFDAGGFEPGSSEPWVPIGVPVWNTRLLVLDERGRPQPLGAPGELHIGGVQLARGYLGRADLTAQRFIPDPLRPGERLYRTGDVARLRGDGAILYVGRMDRQEKIRGQRIEPGEVESVLAGDPGVATVLVRAQSGTDGKVLVAYVVPTGEETAAGSQDPAQSLLPRLRALAESRLTTAMRPLGYRLLNDPVLTPSGKLDSAALTDLTPSELTGGAPIAEDVVAAPSSPTEELLCRLFAEVLGLASVTPEQDFFDLGGHSLLAVRLAGRVRDLLGERVGVAAVFGSPTPAGLAEAVRHGALGDDLAPVLALRSSGRRPPLFCVHPAGGLGWCYAGLLGALPADQPVYSIQARGVDGTEALPTSLSAMAADYVDLVRKTAPGQPVRLLGWSVGGMLVHEMAAQLATAGERVDLVVMMDAYPGPQWRTLPPPSEQESLRAVLRMAAADLEDSAEILLTRAETVRRLRESGSALAGLETATLESILRIVENCAAIVRSAEHRRYDGDVVFIEAEGSREQPWLDPDGWSRLIGGRFLRHSIAGRHQDLVSPAALRQIAALLDPLL